MNDQPTRLDRAPEPLDEALVVPEAGEPTDVDQTPAHQEELHELPAEENPA